MKTEFNSASELFDAGYALPRWGTDQWVFYHMIYTCPNNRVVTETVTVNKIAVKAAKIEKIICNQSELPKHNENIESRVLHEMSERGKN